MIEKSTEAPDSACTAPNSVNAERRPLDRCTGRPVNRNRSPRIALVEPQLTAARQKRRRAASADRGTL